MIDLNLEQPIPLSGAASLVNPTRPANISTVWRWALHGVRGVRLESIMLGGVRHTSREAVQRFLAALNSDDPQAVPAPVNTRARRADAALVAKGA